MKDGTGMKTLYLFFAVYFIYVGMTGMVPKFYGEIGLSDSQIGGITTVITVVGLLLQPAWGTLADRAKYKKTVLALGLAVAGVISFLVLPVSGNYGLLLLTLTAFNIFLLPAMPVSNAIGIEYTTARRKNFGPIRMMGTVGYQAGILGVGLVLAESLRGLYQAIGIILLISAALALLLPPVRGHQGSKGKKVPMSVLLRDRNIVLLLAVTFFAHIGHQFSLSFFTKHLGDLGMGNSLTGLITMLSVSLEIPFLLVGDRLMRKLSIWRWQLCGLLIGTIRFAMLSFVRTPVMLVFAQTLSIVYLACFEFFPMLYLGKSVKEELQVTGQSMLQMISFGLARIVGAMAGGLIADARGIPFVFGLIAVMTLCTAAVFARPLLRRDRAERTLGR